MRGDRSGCDFVRTNLGPVRRPNARIVTAGALAAAFLLAGCGGSSGPASARAADTDAGSEIAGPAAVSLVPPEEAKSLLDSRDDLVLIDVRTPQEHYDAHLAGATLIDFHAPDFGERMAELDRDTGYVLYCRSGNRSAQAAALMVELGFVEVYDVDGGILAWTDSALPLE